MQLVCPKCQSSYSVADNALGESGRSVRCVRCKHVWFAKPEVAMAEAVAQAVERDHAPADAPNTNMAAPETSPDAAVTGDAAWPRAEDAAPPPHIEDAPPVVPEPPAGSPPEGAAGATEKPDYFALRRRQAAFKKIAKLRGAGLINAARLSIALTGILIALVYERDNIVRVLPQTASFYSLLGFHINSRGLAFEGFTTATETQDGVPVLLIEGEIRNVTGAIQKVSHLRFALRNAAGAEIYTWTGVPERNLMAPGDVQKVHTRLASPPSESRDARVRFVLSRDMVAAAARH